MGLKSPEKTITVTVERTLATTPEEAFAAWLDPDCPANIWHEHKTLLFTPKVDGLFYWNFDDNPHYGRFTELAPGKRIVHTWMSPSTSGFESTVTITFKKQGESTVMTLVHTGLPDTD